MLISSLRNINIDESKFPIFYKDDYLNHEKHSKKNCEVWLYINNEINGIIPFSTVKLKIITKGQYLFTPCDFQGNELDSDSEKVLVEGFHKFLARNKIVDVILPPSHFSVFKTIPTFCQFYPMGLIVYNLVLKNDHFLEAMKPNYRNEIRKLDNFMNLKFYTETDDFEKAFNLMKSTLDLQNKSFIDFNEFKSIRDSLKGKFLLKVCEDGDKILGCALFIYDNKSAYYLYSGNEKSKEYPGINKKLLLLSFQDFKILGIKELILGGYRNPEFASKKINDIQNFKLRFGSEILIGYHFIKVINPMKYSIFNLLVKLKSKIKGKNLELLNLEGIDIKKSS